MMTGGLTQVLISKIRSKQLIKERVSPCISLGQSLVSPPDVNMGKYPLESE